MYVLKEGGQGILEPRIKLNLTTFKEDSDYNADLQNIT
jgi:hypothetical protein